MLLLIEDLGHKRNKEGEKMKKLLIVIAIVTLMASAAMADQVSVGTAGFPYGQYQTGQGGEFTLTPTTAWLDLSGYSSKASNIASTGSFQTFCIEGGEYIYPLSTVDAAISKNAIWGGVGPAGDPLSVGTGWLYSRFASGTLDYAYGGTLAERQADADQLQKAIWWLEGEETSTYSSTNKYIIEVLTAFNNDEAAAKNGGAWTYGVFALNLTSNSGTSRYQDQLYYRVPDGGLTLLLLGLGVGGLALFSRKFSQ